MIDYAEPGVDELIASDSPLVLPHATSQPHDRPRFSRLWFPGAREVPGGWYGPGVGGGVDTKISALPAATSFLDADEFPVNEAGVTKKVSGTLLKAWVGDVLGNQSTTDQSPAAATATYLTNSNIPIPVGKLRIGTWFKWHLEFSKTGAGTAARVFTVRLGTLGTTGDATILTYTSGIPTAVIDQGWLDIWVVCRGPLSGSGIFQSGWSASHNLQTTGLLPTQSEFKQVTSGAVDVTVANLIIGLVITTGAAEALTFQTVVVEAKNL